MAWRSRHSEVFGQNFEVQWDCLVVEIIEFRERRFCDAAHVNDLSVLSPTVCCVLLQDCWVLICLSNSWITYNELPSPVSNPSPAAYYSLWYFCLVIRHLGWLYSIQWCSWGHTTAYRPKNDITITCGRSTAIVWPRYRSHLGKSSYCLMVVLCIPETHIHSSLIVIEFNVLCESKTM